ncbi:creatininase [Georgenia yuyongxinii]|uniref:Creatininase n=1 Tax=Georgenia yuyongxinii TaxID=2589797 RepID=A0A5B8BZK7_9MICO|nr:creatininase [Georgenia yuyongxinii]QDC23754.1 creatininase [Georgenia yuyongxinii]
MARSVFMEDLDAFTYRERVADGAPVLIPVGSIEQHGPHMPLSVDVLLSKAMAGAVAERTGSLVAAPIVYGYKSQQRSGGGNHLTGSTSLDAATVIATAKSLVLELARHGVRKIAFVNGHYENYQFLYEGVDLALGELRLAGTEDVRVMLMSYWDFVDDAAIAELYPDGFPGWDLEHGGVLETSLMLLLHPHLVDMDRVADIPPAVLPTYDLLPARPEITPPSGCLSSGAAATAGKGRVLLDRASAGMVTAIRSEFGM